MNAGNIFWSFFQSVLSSFSGAFDWLNTELVSGFTPLSLFTFGGLLVIIGILVVRFLI